MYCSPLLAASISQFPPVPLKSLNNKLTQPQPTLPPTTLPKMDLCPAFITLKYVKVDFEGKEKKGGHGEGGGQKD